MLLDLLFPIKCYQCGQPGKYLCEKCLIKIRFIYQQICPFCHKLSLKGLTHPQCKNKNFSLDGLVSLYPYAGLAGKLIRDYKYYSVKKFLYPLADLTIQGLKINKFQSRFWYQKKFIFLPIPLFPAKQLYRGFNQAEEILNQVSLSLNLEYNNCLLIRDQWTKQQSELGKTERIKNVQSAFKIKNKIQIKQKSFVIFDDVWTTGSTMKSAANVLIKAGAKNVWGLTICRSF